jgi:transcriptional regulator with PAS, ATPase and Fis domain
VKNPRWQWYASLTEEDQRAVRWAEYMERGPITREELDAIMPPRRKQVAKPVKQQIGKGTGKKRLKVSRLSEVGMMVKFQPEKAARLIKRTLRLCNGDLKAAAGEFGVHRASVYLWLRELEIEPAQARGRRKAS